MTVNSFYHEENVLTLLFHMDRKEERRALGTFRAAFGATADLEAVTENLMAMHIRPGYPVCSPTLPTVLRAGEKVA